MIKKLILFIIVVFLIPINAKAEEFRYIEIFSIDEGKVVKLIQSNSEIESLVYNYLNAIDGVYSKFDPVPKEGYAIKLTLNPSLKVQSKWINCFVDRVIIMLPTNDNPFLMVFENDNKLVCFTFKGDVDSLLKSLNFSLDDKKYTYTIF
ncbi:hypothetical protein [Desnuesiella massiliensis]|uniref:hypothetical protein n=1 Tax=Desnuesiella massiliensis TaxID=1650662 RepID=UPI0006E1EF95|nr:hypothetical protein [Desnuesiella massiliensis]